MMRFDRLEFEDPSPRMESAAGHGHGHAPLHDASADRDERHWLRVATDERRNGVHEGALRHYSRALELDKSLVDGWVGQVRMLIALGEYPEADLWGRKALELFKNNAELLAGRAQALCRTGDLKSAQASADAALAQQGLYSYPWLARGELLLARGEAVEEYCFDKAVQLDADWLVLLDVADVYEHYAKPTKALSRVREAVERAPGHAHCWYRQGACELALGLTAAAERSFARCLELAPKHVNARRQLFDLSVSRRPVRRWFQRWFGRR